MIMAILFSSFAHAAYLDTSGPTDILGRPQVDLYDATGAQRGTQTNPLYINEPLDQTSATTNITTADLGSATATQFSGQTSTTGTPTASSSAVMALGSVQTSMVIITGTWTGNLQIEVSSDGGVTYQPRSIHVLGSPIFAAVVNQNVVGSINATAKTHVRVRAISAITGTAQVKFVGSANQSNVYVGNAIKLVDGTTTTAPPQLAIKAANTPATATDTAAVVTISPNTPVVVDDRPWVSRTLSGNGTTVIKTGSAILHGFVINNNATGGTIILYDNTAGSGTIAAAGLAGTPSGGLLSGSGNPGAQLVGPLDISVTNGITAVTSGSNNNSFTVIYR